MYQKGWEGDQETSTTEEPTGDDTKMILKIDNKYRIRTDNHNFMLEKKREGKKERWVALCYCKSLDHVLESVRDEKIRNLSKHTLEEFSGLLHALTQEIKAIGRQCVSLWGSTPE